MTPPRLTQFPLYSNFSPNPWIACAVVGGKQHERYVTIILKTIYNVAISGLQESAEIDVYNNSLVAEVTTFLGLGSIRHTAPDLL